MSKPKDDKPESNGKPKGRDDVVVLSTPEFRLKDKPANRAIQFINLKRQFGMIPDVIAVEKVKGQNNRIIVRGFVPKQNIPQIEIASRLPAFPGKKKVGD